MTIEEAKNALENLPLPAVQDGDIVWYPDETGHRFKWKNGEWVSHPEE